VDAFVVPTTQFSSRRSTAHAFSPLDPSHLNDLPNHIQSLQDAFSSLSIADVDVAGAGAAVEEAAKTTNNGWFGFLTGPTMAFLELIHSGLVAVGVSSDSWGVSIIMLTVAIKLLTFPLTKSQLESTNKMQVSIYYYVFK
jgi:YidC/Oxa1 family membrane protein insertase